MDNLNSISQGYKEGERFSAQRSTFQYDRREYQRGRSSTDSSRRKALLALDVMVPCYLASALCYHSSSFIEKGRAHVHFFKKIQPAGVLVQAHCGFSILFLPRTEPRASVPWKEGEPD
jgi:hypothetical protein